MADDSKGPVAAILDQEPVLSWASVMVFLQAVVGLLDVTMMKNLDAVVVGAIHGVVFSGTVVFGGVLVRAKVFSPETVRKAGEYGDAVISQLRQHANDQGALIDTLNTRLFAGTVDDLSFGELRSLAKAARLDVGPNPTEEQLRAAIDAAGVRLMRAA
jgi:hypothetical protein